MRSFGFKLVRSDGMKPTPPHLPGQWDLSSGTAFLPGFQPRCSVPTQCGGRARERAETSDVQRKK